MNVRLDLPDHVLDDLVERVTARVLEQLDASRAEAELMNVREAAEFLRCSRQRVYDLLSDGRLERFKDGSRGRRQARRSDCPPVAHRCAIPHRDRRCPVRREFRIRRSTD